MARGWAVAAVMAVTMPLNNKIRVQVQKHIPVPPRNNIIVAGKGHCKFADAAVIALSPDRSHAFYFVRKGDSLTVFDDVGGQMYRHPLGKDAKSKLLNFEALEAALRQAPTLDEFLWRVQNAHENKFLWHIQKGDKAFRPVARDTLGVAARYLPSLHIGRDFFAAHKATTARMAHADVFANALDKAFEHLGVTLEALISNPHASNPVEVDTLQVNDEVLSEAYRPYVNCQPVVDRENARRRRLPHKIPQLT